MNELETQRALIDIALVKAYNYMQEYCPTSGRIKDRVGHTFLKEGFVDGFLAGVAFRMTGGLNESSTDTTNL